MECQARGGEILRFAATKTSANPPQHILDIIENDFGCPDDRLISRFVAGPPCGGSEPGRRLRTAPQSSSAARFRDAGGEHCEGDRQRTPIPFRPSVSTTCRRLGADAVRRAESIRATDRRREMCCVIPRRPEDPVNFVFWLSTPGSSTQTRGCQCRTSSPNEASRFKNPFASS